MRGLRVWSCGVVAGDTLKTSSVVIPPIRVIRVPFPADSRDVACRVSPLVPVCYQNLFRVPIPAGNETRHATLVSHKNIN